MSSTSDEDGLMIFKNNKWVTVAKDELKNVSRFSEIKYFYGNIIDYIRVAMCVLAGFTVVWNEPFLSAVLIIGSHLLDWVDGPVARYFNQCTIFGSGVDWLADVQAQVVTMVWWVTLDKSVLPWIMIATTIEMATCIWDYAQTATLRYPTYGRKSGVLIILEWTMPGGKYSKFGTFLWLAYPLYCVACCLDLSWPVRSAITDLILHQMKVFLFVPAVMYIWCELAQLIVLLNNWMEPKRNSSKPQPIFNDDPHGFSYLGIVPPSKQQLLNGAMDTIKNTLGSTLEDRMQSKEIYWINIWQQATGRSEEWRNIPRIDELEAYVKDLYTEWFDDTTDEFDGYGFIINPMGSRTQAWHLDYRTGYASIFIPITTLSPSNATQYVVLPEGTKDIRQRYVSQNPDSVNLEDLVNTVDYVSVRQMLVKPFSILRMEFDAIHRGITNNGNYNRIVFWISVRKRSSPKSPTESVIQTFDKDKAK